jgi:hypothetical protein
MNCVGYYKFPFHEQYFSPSYIYCWGLFVADSCVPLLTAPMFGVFNHMYSCFLPLLFILASCECLHTIICISISWSGI